MVDYTASIRVIQIVDKIVKVTAQNEDYALERIDRGDYETLDTKIISEETLEYVKDITQH